MNHRHHRSALLWSACALAATFVAHSRPVAVEESQSLEAPQPGWTFLGESVAIDGDSALATALFSADGSYNYPYRQMALLYRRSGDTWTFDRVLVDDPTDENSWNDAKVAMKGNLASVSTTPLRMFRRSGGGWIGLTQPFPGGPTSPAWANGAVRIDGTTVAAIAGRCNHGVVTTNLGANDWSDPERVPGNARICSLPNNSGAVDVDSNRLVFTNPQEDSSFPANQTRIYLRSGPGAAWNLEDTLPVGDFGVGLALRNDELFVGGSDPRGNDIFRRDGSAWTHSGYLPTLRGYDSLHEAAFHIARSDDFILASTSPFDGRPAGIAVYRKGPNGEYQHVAQLASSRGDSLGPVMEISGRTVITGGWRSEAPDQGRLYFFELPDDLTPPALMQDDFEDGNAAGWTIQSGTMTVERRGPSRVLRQASTAGWATAVLNASNMTNQSVQAEFRPIDFAAGDHWFGVATHYTNAANHYYAVLRSGGFVTLRRVQAGRHVTLGNRVLPVSKGRRYQLRLESIGSRQRVYVNGQLWLEAFDGILKAGRAALLTQGASADIDNVVVTPDHRTPLYEAEIPNGAACEDFVTEQGLRVSGQPEWDCTDFEGGYLRQASMQGVTRAAIGPITDDQAVESRVQLEAFADSGGEDQWIGVMTRYTDENNYYYFSLRSSKRMALRKLVDGRIVELGETGFTLGVGDWHVFRLEAIGDRLRAYIDGQLLMEARDASHPVGISGFATYRAAARFDYLRVTQP
jgi:hypothetical protein